MECDFGELKKLDLRPFWPNEQYNFTPWLVEEDNVAKLGAAIGLELEVENIEVAVGPYSADILAKDTATGTYVVIENQLEKTNHDHLGKLITYGSVLDASAIVWIASEFTEEHARALAWLNDNTSEDLAFYGVRLEVWQIEESKPTVVFNVISRPAGVKPKDAKRPEGDISEARKLQLDFWTAVRNKLLESRVVPSAQKARAQYWYDVALGRSGIVLSNVANTYENRIGVRVYISNKVVDAALPQLLEQKEEIEREIGADLEWDPNPEARDKIIRIHLAADLTERDKMGEYVDWMVDMIGRFRRTFGPRVKKLSL